VENPGLILFRDEFIFRSVVTRAQREQRAVVIAHEMAHMWFGDLVTLRWWDDIWLNESFAEYMGWRVAVEATPFVDAWTTFAVGRKGGGYVADQRPSTHPVAPTDVHDTAQALANFDGISYAKGASVLRQMVAWLGDETFLSGVRAYFAAHAFGNATLADLLTALSQSSGRDLGGWAEVWLRRAQLNTLRPQVTLGPDGRYAEVAVVQSAPEEYPTLRPHRIGVGVYDGDPAVLRQRVEVDLDPGVDGGRTTVDALAGVQPGRLLLLNDGDLTFAKVRFDEASRAGLAGVLPRLGDSLARAVVWAAAADATRDAELTAADYLALAVAGLPAESEVAVFEERARVRPIVRGGPLSRTGCPARGAGGTGRRLPAGP
jgi:aminopeptidase N